jgi:hypothetical protein
VTTWYDQSGLGRDAIQTGASNQPKIVSSGSINMLNGKPSIRFDQSLNNYLYVNSSSVLNIQDCISTFTVGNFVGNGGYYGHLMCKGYLIEGAYSLGVFSTVGNQIQIWIESDRILFTPTLNINQQHIYSNTNAVGSNGIKLYVDNSLFSESTTTNNLNGTNDYLFSIGRNNRENSYYLDGNIQEIICYPTYQQTNLSPINTNINSHYSIYTSYTTTVYNPLTTAWISATGETDLTIINSVNNLETGLIGIGISKFDSLYFNRTGNATKDAFDFMNIGRSQSFSGGWTLTTQGAKPNGTNAYSNMNFNLRTNSVLNNFSVIHCTNENTAQWGYDFGATAAQQCLLISRYFNGNCYGTVDNSANPTAATLVGGTTIFTVDSLKLTTLYKNGSSIASFTTTQTNFPNLSPYYCALNANGPANMFGSKRCQVMAIGKHLTAGEVSTLTTLLNTFNATR